MYKNTHRHSNTPSGSVGGLEVSKKVLACTGEILKKSIAKSFAFIFYAHPERMQTERQELAILLGYQKVRVKG